MRAIAGEAAAGRLDPDKIDERTIAPPPLRARHARSRPARAHVGRVPDLELPAVGARVLRARLHRRALARLPPRAPLRTPSPSTSAATAASAPSYDARAANARPWRSYGDARRVALRCHAGAVSGRGGRAARRSSSVRPIASSRSSPRATARSAPSPRASARRRASSAPGSSRRAASRCSATGAASSTSSPRPRRSRRTGSLREEYGLLTHAVPMLEAVDQVAQEREPNPALYRMLTGALRTLARAAEPGRHARVLLEAALARGLPSDARRLRPLRRAPTTATTTRAGRVRSRRGRHAVPGVRARRRPAGVARRRSHLLRRMLGGGLERRARRAARPGDARGRAARHPGASSTTSSAACGRPSCSERPARSGAGERGVRPSSLARYGRAPSTPS